MSTTPPRSESADSDAAADAARFGQMIRARREAAGMTQDELAFVTGVGRRFVIELERGKPTCQLGKALQVAAALGLRPFEPNAGASIDPLPEPPGFAEAELPIYEPGPPIYTTGRRRRGA